MEQFKSNSNSAKERRNKPLPEKKVSKVVSGRVRTKKKSELRKFTDIFISEDASNVKSYVFLDILVPAIKKAISDIVVSGVDMVLYGETGHTKKNSPASKISYRDYYNRRDPRDYSANRTRTGYSYDDIVLDNRGEAEDVIEKMDELISTYGQVSVADLYDLVGVTGNYTDNKYGWTDIRSASIVRVHNGYLIKMPKALPLD